jgi:chlorite dismutase|tara:strand:- start:2528 stop:2731 length:204 start_codon:yes stop_codon:yes gene_type:complete
MSNIYFDKFIESLNKREQNETVLSQKNYDILIEILDQTKHQFAEDIEELEEIKQSLAFTMERLRNAD